MVTAGTRKRYNHGAREKRASSEAYPPSRILLFPGKTHKNRLVANRNTKITMYPVSDPKKLVISFLNKLNIPKYE